MDRIGFFSFIKVTLFVGIVTGTSPPKLCYKPEDFVPEICPYYGVETHYRELGCKPIFPYDGACCPDSYDCSHFETMKSEAIDKCFYGGRSYLLNTEIDDNDMKEKCAAGCSCNEGYPSGFPAHFSCAEIECPRELEGYFPMDPCYYKSSPGECCPTEYCPSNDTTTPPGCTFEGKTYRDGEDIYPSDRNLSYKCKSCICMAGKVECETYSCGMGLYSFTDIVVTGAVPLYFGMNDCCAIDYIYPADTDTVGKTNEVRTSENKCKFGSLELEIGDELVQEAEKCAKCTCIIPPFITCLKSTVC